MVQSCPIAMTHPRLLWPLSSLEMDCAASISSLQSFKTCTKQEISMKTGSSLKLINVWNVAWYGREKSHHTWLLNIFDSFICAYIYIYNVLYTFNMYIYIYSIHIYVYIHYHIDYHISRTSFFCRSSVQVEAVHGGSLAPTSVPPHSIAPATCCEDQGHLPPNQGDINVEKKKHFGWTCFFMLVYI